MFSRYKLTDKGRRELSTGRILNDHRNYNEAEKEFRQALDGQERTLGQDHEDTLYSKYWLGHTLYNQRRYNEAEKEFRQALDGQERTLGQDHEDTLSSKHQLGRTLYSQKKYNEAEKELRQTANGRERTLGHDYKDTLTTVRLLEELRLKTSLLLPTNNTPQQALAGRLKSYFLEGQDKREPYTGSEINEISTLLKHSNPRWSKLPRTYIILRIVGHIDVLENLITSGFSDY
jgi:tetratricopeptide (TPR) repeat protein